MSESVNEKKDSTHPLTNSSTHLLKTSIIQVKHLSKRYQIGMDRTYKTFCESVTDTIKSPLKRLKSFSRQEETFWALKDINLEVNPGEVVGIIGRNGAGKTTLLKILSQITYPTEGEAILKGRVRCLLEVGTGFHAELTGRENIYFSGSILGMKNDEIEDKFDEIVEFAGTKKFLDTPVKRYSSGMAVRLAFAVAAHLDAEILLVDEVLAVGDVPFQKKCLAKMGEVATAGRTVLFVSHNMEAIKKLCTRAILLEEGRIVMDGPADVVVNKYLGEGMGLVEERIWPESNKAPGDDVVRLHAARVLDRNGEVCINFDVRDPVSIELEYLVLEEGHHLQVHFSFINEMGHAIFTSKDNLDSPWRDTVCPTGHYRTICHIPGDFFNEGEFSIYCAITSVSGVNLGHVNFEDLVIFKVSDRMDPGGVRGNYPLTWLSGGVRPRFHWSVEKTT